MGRELFIAVVRAVDVVAVVATAAVVACCELRLRQGKQNFLRHS